MSWDIFCKSLVLFIFVFGKSSFANTDYLYYVDCGNQDDLKILDLVEGELFSDYDWNREVLQQPLQDFIHTLNQRLPLRAKKYRERINSLEKVEIVNQKIFPMVPPADFLILPDGCQVLPLANYQIDLRNIEINLEIYDQLEPLSKFAVYLHMITAVEVDPILRRRQWTTFLLSENFFKFSFEKFVNQLKSFDLAFVYQQGVPIDIEHNIKYYDENTIKEASARKGLTVLWQEQDLLMTGEKVQFHANGQVKVIYFSGVYNYQYTPDQLIPVVTSLQNEPIYFYESGLLKRAYIREATKIHGKNFSITVGNVPQKPESLVTLFETGDLRSAWPVAKGAVTVDAQELQLKYGSAVEISQTNELRQFTTTSHFLASLLGQKILVTHEIELGENRELKRAWSAQNFSFTFDKTKIDFAKEYMFSYDYKFRHFCGVLAKGRAFINREKEIEHRDAYTLVCVNELGELL
ncbi:MAG: hypothetical protein KDD40_06105 [Bdellovibrionales bacterium]|nr:hypothetical protein [Bdellovibrionales bacterium]